MNRVEKESVVEELRRTFQESPNLLLVDFTGLNVPDATELRRRVRESGSHYRVLKNRLALRALEGTPAEGLKEHFQGPTALASTSGDPVALAKVLKEFIADHESMAFKAGLVEGQALGTEEVVGLADLPSRPQLLSKLVYLLNAPLARLAMALQSPLRGLASVLGQLEEQKEN